MSSTSIPDRTITLPVDELAHVRDLLSASTRALRSGAVVEDAKPLKERDVIKAGRMRGRAATYDRIAQRFDKAIRERPLPASLSDIEDELVA